MLTTDVGDGVAWWHNEYLEVKCELSRNDGPTHRDHPVCEQFPIWLHTYSYRGDTALGGQIPDSRVPKLPGEYS